MNQYSNYQYQTMRWVWETTAAESNSSAALQDDGNTYKNLYEVSSMSRGLTVVVLINVCVSLLGLLFYRYFILKEAGLMTEEETSLLNRYPDIMHTQMYSYSPNDDFVRAPPPMSWTGWSDFLFRSDDNLLSKDAKVYLMFVRACILTTAACGAFASIMLLPWYWFGGALFKVGEDATNSGTRKPLTLISLLKSDRGLFERFTSHNLPPNSPLILLQFPVMVVVAFCVVFMYTVVKSASDEHDYSTNSRNNSNRSKNNNSVNNNGTNRPDRDASHSSVSSDLMPDWSPGPAGNRRQKKWTLFVRGLPMDIGSSSELAELLSSIYPSQIDRVELVCKGRIQEVKLMRKLLTARYRYKYLLERNENSDMDEEEDEKLNRKFGSKSFLGRVFGISFKKWTREEVLDHLQKSIHEIENDIHMLKSKPVHGFRGCAFITFTNSKAAETVLKHGAKIIEADETDGDYDDDNESQSSILTGDTASTRIFEQSIGGLLPAPHSAPSGGAAVTFPREELIWEIPRLENLYRAIVDILPRGMRDWIRATSWLAPTERYYFSDRNEMLVWSREKFQYGKKLAAVRLRNMNATRAPNAGDIIWQNVGISFIERTIREIIVQFIVFSILILFTSPIAMLTAGKLLIQEVSLLTDPSIIANNNSTVTGTGSNNPLVPTINVKDDNAALSIAYFVMQKLPQALSNNDWLRSTIFTYVPVLMLAIVFAVVPTLLRQTCKWEGYPTKSAQELSVFRKTAFYYVMNAVVLPSLALNTMSEFLEVLYKRSNGGSNISSAFPILERLFSGDIAFFLCNYLVQLALTGSVFWLMRLPGSFKMMIRKRVGLTPLELAEAKCTDIFDYPRHYAYCVTVMSMCLLFGFMAPLLWWFSFGYFVCKFAVDIYLIRFVHPRSHIDGRLPRLSISFVLIWTVVSQLSIAVIFYLQNWTKSAFACVLLCSLTLAACLSAGEDVGNLLLALIDEARKELVRRVVGDGDNVFGWALGSAQVNPDGNNHYNSHSHHREEEVDSLIGRREFEHTNEMNKIQQWIYRRGQTPPPSQSSYSSITHVHARPDSNDWKYQSLEDMDDIDTETHTARTSVETRVEAEEWATFGGELEDGDDESIGYNSDNDRIGLDIEFGSQYPDNPFQNWG